MTLPPNFSNAVDLSSLGKPKAEPIKVDSIAVNPEILTTQLLPLSKTKPVIVICWSSKSPESIETFKILAKLHDSEKDKWQLADVEVEQQQQVATALQTRTVPYAVAMVNEQIIPLFENAYPETQLRMVLDKVLTLAAEQGIGELVEEKVEPEEEAALQALDKGDFQGAIAEYQKLISRKPNDKLAKLGLAQVQLIQRTKDGNLRDVASAAAANPNDVELAIKCADLEIVSGQTEPAFNRLLTLIKKSTGDEREKTKKHLLILFELIDPADPVLIKARGELASALF